MKGHHEQVKDLFKEIFKDKEFIGIEIGTALADMTKAVLWAFPNLRKIYTIDPYHYKPERGFESSFPIEKQEFRRNHARNALKEFEDRCLLIEDTSDNAVSLTPDEVDFVWIDGDHNQDQIYKDIVNYYNKVKVNGVFGGHDYQHAIPVFRDMINGIIYLGDDWTWWIIKDNRLLKI